MFLSCMHPPLYDHLRNTLASECLAALELLALEASKRIKDGGE